MSVEILIVDDSEGLALNTAQFVENKLGMPVAYAVTSRNAIETLEQNPVAVVVLDQRMEGDISGTDLFLRLKKIRPQIKAIMLTGQAERDEVGRALHLGFDDYLSKGEISGLPIRVLQQYLEYETETSQTDYALDVLIWPKRPGLRLWRRYEAHLKAVVVTESRMVDPSSWLTLLQISAGESKTLSRQLTTSHSVTLEESSQNSLKSSLSLTNRALVDLTASIEQTLTSSWKTSSAVTETGVRSTEQVFKLPDEPSDSQVVFIRSRSLQGAPISRRIIATIELRCRCCDLSRFLPLAMTQETGLIATRQVDYMSDKSVKTVETGDILIGSAIGSLFGVRAKPQSTCVTNVERSLM